MTSTHRWYSTAQAAVYLGRAPITLRKWRVIGVGPAHQIVNSRAMYDIADLDRYIESCPKYRSTSERSALAGAA